MSRLDVEALDVVARLAAPFNPADREQFIAMAMEKLAAAGEVGPGLAHRIAAEVQRPFIAGMGAGGRVSVPRSR